MRTERIKTDVLIIGGGTAGCFAAYVIGQKSERKVLIAEKANIKRSGCLAAGVNALNAYITEGRVPQDYVDYAKKDAHGIVREDLLLSMSERLNHVTKVMEDLGLVILKDENGKYVARGNRNIKINGENMKPILAKAAAEQENVTVLNHINITDYKTENGKITGAVGFGVNEDIFYDIDAEALKAARSNAKMAGVDRLIHFQQRAVKDLSHPKPYGFLITNPPYGERLEEKAALPQLYREIGESFNRLDKWSMYLITSYDRAENDIGKKADKNRKIYNGMLKTYYYQFLGPKPPRRNANK